MVKFLAMKLEAARARVSLHFRNTVVNERGEWLGSLGWTVIYGLAAVAIGLAIVGALTGLQNRTITDIGLINP